MSQRASAWDPIHDLFRRTKGLCGAAIMQVHSPDAIVSQGGGRALDLRTVKRARMSDVDER
eukprot:15609134-Heterocapsa_arctica.AAC.1